MNRARICCLRCLLKITMIGTNWLVINIMLLAITAFLQIFQNLAPPMSCRSHLDAFLSQKYSEPFFVQSWSTTLLDTAPLQVGATIAQK